MANLTSSLIVRLIDQVSAPARAAAKAIRGIGEALGAVSGRATAGLAERLNGAIEANRQRLSQLRGSLFDAAAMGASLYAGLKAPTSLARDFEAALLDIGQKADLTDASIAVLGRAIRALGPSVNQASLDLAKGVDILAGMGLDPDRALALMRPIGMAATAYKAQIEDLAKAGFAALDNLKVKPEEFGRALDAMAQSGKEGAFELRDMAQYFPSLTAAAQAFGMTGVKAVADLAAALQIARKGAGDSAEAANNVANLLQKIISPETTKNFQKLGVDIRKELKAALKAGKSPIEMVTELTAKALKGDLTRLGDIFQDRQVQQALRPLIQNLEEYRRIREKSLSARGVIDNDFERRLKTGEAQLKRFTVRLRELGLSIGAIILPAVNDLLGHLARLAAAAQAVAEKFPEVTKAAIMAVAGLVGFRAAAIAVRYAATLMQGAVLAAAAALLAVGRAAAAVILAPLRAALAGIAAAAVSAAAALRAFAVAAILSPLTAARGMLVAFGAGLLALLNPFRLVRAALVALRFGLVGAAIGTVLAGIAAAGTWIANNWQGITVAFEAFKGAFDRAIAPIKPALEPIGNLFAWLGEKISTILGPLDETNARWAVWGMAAGKAVGTAVVALVELVRKLAEIPGKVAAEAGALYDAGTALIQRLWDGAAAKLGEFLDWVRNIPERIKAAIGAIDLSGLIKWPSMPSWLGGAPRQPAAPASPAAPTVPARAAGGSIDPATPTLVGEEGPELVTASRVGFVHDASATERMLGSPAAAAPGATAAIDPGAREAGRMPSAGPAAALVPPAARLVSAPISITFGNIVIHGAHDAREIADEVAAHLDTRLRAALRGLQADLEYTS